MAVVFDDDRGVIGAGAVEIVPCGEYGTIEILLVEVEPITQAPGALRAAVSRKTR
jgi:hypothetical protein